MGALMAVLIAACTPSAPPPACPRAAILSELATVTKFRSGPARDLTDVTAQGEIFDILVGCKYDRQGVTVDLQLAIRAQRGPADQTRRAQLEFFVAVADAQRNILNKAVFPAVFEFREGQTTVARVEELEPVIPRATAETGPTYEILVGFQLTPDEIEWNRRARGR